LRSIAHRQSGVCGTLFASHRQVHSVAGCALQPRLFFPLLPRLRTLVSFVGLSVVRLILRPGVYYRLAFLNQCRVRAESSLRCPDNATCWMRQP
jgi:hypothetical protein